MVRPDIVQKALQVIRKRTANYEYFFDHLNSPAWIEPLYQGGYFRKPPPAEQIGEHVRYRRWPESEYLARMVRISAAQQQVLDIALGIPDTDNVRVHEDLADIALSLPPSMATRFVPEARKWLGARHHLLLPEKLGALITHLAKGDEGTPALTLAKAVLAVVPDQTPTEDERHDGIFSPTRGPHPRFEEWVYERVLKQHVPTLVEMIGEPALVLLCDVLAAAVPIWPPAEEDGILADYSDAWRPAIENHGQNSPHSLKDHLVTAVRDAAELILRLDPGRLTSVVTLLEARKNLVFHRIALHLMRHFPGAALELVAARLTDRHRFENVGLHHEYVLLTKDGFPRLAEQEQETILKWIAEGPNLEEWRDFQEQFAGRRPSNQDAQQYKRTWQRDRLAPLANALSTTWKQYYDELIRDFGLAEHPEFLVYSERTWVGPTSPKSREELRSMSTDEIATFLGNWELPGDSRSPTPEGLGRALADVVASDPQPFAAAASRFQTVDPTYVRNLLSGLRDAVRKGRPFAWEPVLDLAQWVVEQNRGAPEVSAGSADRDPGWGWSRKAVADLLSTGLDDGPAEMPFRLRQRVWAVLRPLTDDPNPTPEHEARYEGANMDPATLSINTTRGEAIHTVLHYALWVRRSLEAEGQSSLDRSFDEMPEVRDVLELHLDPKLEPSLAIRSVYGQWFPWLLLLDSRWTAANKGRIFPAAPDQGDLLEAAWETYIVFCKLYDAAFDTLREEYGRAIDRIGVQSGHKHHQRDVDQRLAEHLMEAYWRGKLSLDDSESLLGRFYTKADDVLRGHAMEFMGRSLDNTDGELSVQIINRLKALWRYRTAAAQASVATDFREELSGFGWWFASRYFDPDWALPELVEILHLVHVAEPSHLVAERLAEIAAEYPLEVVECFKDILHWDNEGWRIAGLKNELRSALSTILNGAIPVAKSAAEDLIHQLGARGHREFRDLLQ